MWVFASGFFGGHFYVMGDQCHQGVLLTTGKLAETLQQLALMQAQFRAVEAQVELVAQCAFLKHALLQASDDLRIHAAMMVTCYVSDTLTHPIG